MSAEAYMNEMEPLTNKNVFINCPFDDQYKPLLLSLLFICAFCGFKPLLVSMDQDSSSVRLDKIIDLIDKSSLSIHDISRMIAQEEGEISRFNLPFELGIDFGYKKFCNPNKKILILEENHHTYDVAISDISGCDIKVHSAEPELLIRRVRNWFNSHRSCDKGGNFAWQKYNEFNSSFELAMNEAGFDARDIEEMNPKEFLEFVYRFLSNS